MSSKYFTTPTTDQITSLTNTTSFYPIIDLKCDSYYGNNTEGRFLKQYSGIPENLIINLCVWSILLILFTFLRRVGDYGRFGLLQRDHEEERWTTLFFSQSADDMADQTSMNFSNYKDVHFISWIINIFKLKDQHILEKCGKDALYYILFQRYLIMYLTVVTVLSVSIILPINYSGDILSDKKMFGSTTIVNVPPNSPVLWVHLVVSWLFFIFGFIFMRVFSKKMQYNESDYVSRTVIIMNIPNDKCEPDLIQKHFSECYGELEIYDIQLAYEIAELSSIDQERHKMQTGRLTSQKLHEETNQRPTMYPFHCGSLFEICCCCCEDVFYKTDAIDYYTDCEKDLRDKLAVAKELAYNSPLGIAFVTFKNETMASSFLKHYHYPNLSRVCYRCCYCKKTPFVSQKHSSVSHELQTESWTVQYAPSPNNIKWENLSQIDSTWRIRYVAINILLLILMIFFTTPSILIDTFSRWSHDLNFDTYIGKYLPTYLSEFLPSFLLRIFSALLPVLVGYTALLEKHWTKSGHYNSVMLKTFVVLLFMVLILPTVGLTSIDALITFWFDPNQTNKTFKWKCVSDNGAFYVKYITTCMFIGTALDLLRLPELLMYFLKLFWSRSLSERMAVRVQSAYEFDYGTQYAWILTIATVTICFSVVCPLITPFGLFYLILKHFVDRYNIYFAYVYSKVDKKIHKSAVSFFISSLIMLQFCILFFIVIRNRNKDVMVILQSIIIATSSLVFFGHISFGWFKKLSLFTIQTSNNLTEYVTADNLNESNNTSVNQTNTLAESNIESPIPKVKTEPKSQFVPGLLRPSNSLEETNYSISDTVSHISDTNTIDGDAEGKKFDKKINESTITLSSKYGAVSIDN